MENIEERAGKLVEEFLAHRAAFARQQTQPVDLNAVFGLWCCGKLAGMQIAVEAMIEEIQRLQMMEERSDIPWAKYKKAIQDGKIKLDDKQL